MAMIKSSCHMGIQPNPRLSVPLLSESFLYNCLSVDEVSMSIKGKAK